MARLLLVISLFSVFPAQAMYWQGPSGGGHQHGGASNGYRLVDGVGATIEQWAPTLENQHLLPDLGGTVQPKRTGMEYYHALVARKGNQTAVRYVVMRGRPSGHSPSELFEAAKSSLEIVPLPYAREHWRFHAGKQAQFQVRSNGIPLSRVTLSMRTSNGTRRFFNTDDEGMVTVAFPRDFSDVSPGRGNNPAAEFVLGVRNDLESFTLSGPYHVNPDNWQSFSQGALVMMLGFVSGIVLIGTHGRHQGRRNDFRMGGKRS